MWRFIVCSFAFLGWGFYELSGGDEFAPETQSAAIFAPVVVQQKSETPKDTAVKIATASDAEADLVLASVSTRAEPLQPLQAVALVEPAKAEAIVTEQPQDVVAAIEPTPLETRRVKPNRVNVRGGPGTDNEIVAKLLKNDVVSILGDNGDGWYEIETVDGQIGWMADFLLVAAN